VLAIGALVIDPDRHELRVGDAVVECTASEFRILLTMAAAPGRVFSRRQLLTAVHGLSDYVTERTIDAHVGNVRRKIEASPRRPRYLLTVHGVGYKLVDGSRPGHAG
jgi:DNA-binding response OmpR family regulator